MILIGTRDVLMITGSMSITTMEIAVAIEATVLVLITAIGVQGASRLAAEASRVLLGTQTLTPGTQRI
jgi:hypothetical protein